MLLFVPLAFATLSTTPTVEIAPGVHMPALSLGTCCGSEPGVGLLPWLAAGGRGIDTGISLRCSCNFLCVTKMFGLWLLIHLYAL